MRYDSATFELESPTLPENPHAVFLTGDHEAIMLLAGTCYAFGSSDSHGTTPLHNACLAGDAGAVEFLLKMGVDPEPRCVMGKTPMHMAAISGSAEIIEALAAAGSSPRAADRDGWTPLHDAASGGHELSAELLILLGADPKAKTKDGLEPHHAAEASLMALEMREMAGFSADRSEVSRLSSFMTTLREAEADPYMQDLLSEIEADRAIEAVLERTRSEVDLVRAAEQGDLRTIERLLVAGTDPDAANAEGFTALMVAAANDRSDCVELLARAGANPDAMSPDGITALHSACASSSLETIDALLQSGASIHLRSDGGLTPLHFAAAAGRSDVCATLCSEGADPTLRDDAGRTPSDFARAVGSEEVIDAMAVGTKSYDLVRAEHAFAPLAGTLEEENRQTRKAGRSV